MTGSFFFSTAKTPLFFFFYCPLPKCTSSVEAGHWKIIGWTFICELWSPQQSVWWATLTATTTALSLSLSWQCTVFPETQQVWVGRRPRVRKTSLQVAQRQRGAVAVFVTGALLLLLHQFIQHFSQDCWDEHPVDRMELYWSSRCKRFMRATVTGSILRTFSHTDNIHTETPS